jgi:hypothetical protein
MSDIWGRADLFIDSCLDSPPEILIAHGVHLLAINRMRVAGRPLPDLLVEAEKANLLRFLAGRSLLQRIRSLLDGPMVLLKGPEVAEQYPKPTLRAYGDLDILVPDSASAKSILLSQGFEEVDDYEFSHTQRPLRWPGLPLVIELHHQLPWLRWMTVPPTSTFFAEAIPSSTGIDGISTLPSSDHVLLVAAHSWRHVPLRRLNDLIDVVACAEGQDAALLERRANELGMGSVWSTTMRASNALLNGRPAESFPLRVWAKHLYPPRERSVAEVHMARWIGSLWAPTLLGKARSLLATVEEDFRPLPGEPWREKLSRTGRAVREAEAPALLRPRDATDDT